MWKPGFENDDIPNNQYYAQVRDNRIWMDKAESDIALAVRFFLIYLLDISLILT